MGLARSALVVLAACTPRGAVVERAHVPDAGMSITFYRSATSGVAVIDDRRWVDVVGTSVVLDRIDPGSPLPALVIEPLDGDPFEVSACQRARIDPDVTPEATTDSTLVAPVIRCTVRARRGRHLVRVMQVTPALWFRSQHDLTMTRGDRATVTTRFAITTPAWAVDAEVAVHEGMPGADQPARELARGRIQLDGGTSVLVVEAREVTARIRHVFTGARIDPATRPGDLVWGKESRRAVWAWLELDDSTLPAGPVHAHVARPGDLVRDVDVPAAGRERAGGVTRWPLWIDEELTGLRKRTVDLADGVTLVDRLELAVSNAGVTAREVWVEEPLRPARHREVTRAWPASPTLTGTVARTRLVVPPASTARIGYVVRYEL